MKQGEEHSLLIKVDGDAEVRDNNDQKTLISLKHKNDA